MLKKVLARLKIDPTVVEKADVVRKIINDALTKKKINAHAIIGGSVAKNTYLNCFDCDIFVLFDHHEYKEKAISAILENAIKNEFSLQKIRGSRDYYRFKYKEIDYEVIPVLKITKAEDAHNVTDMSPLHIQWVQRNAKGLQDDIRLAKLFCKANNVYGAESYINGFSGYMIEVLVVHYKGFLPLLTKAATWKPKVIIDTDEAYKGNDILKKMNSAKIQGPLLLIDPVDPKRNIASALGEEKFAQFMFQAKRFIEKPGENFFAIKTITIAELKKQAKEYNTELIMLKITSKEYNRDIAGCKILKCVEHIRKEIELHEFRILDADWHFFEEYALMWIFAHKQTLSKVQKKSGPPVYAASQDIEKFIHKHKKVQVENARLVGVDKRKYQTMQQLIAALTKDPWIKEKVHTIRIL